MEGVGSWEDECSVKSAIFYGGGNEKEGAVSKAVESLLKHLTILFFDWRKICWDSHRIDT